MFKANKVKEFGMNLSNIELDDVEYDVMPSNIRSIRPINETQTIIFVKNIKGVKVKEHLLINKTSEQICAEIRALNGENLGDFKVKLDDERIRPNFRILRESDGTAHKTLCVKCGFIKQVYHTQICNCFIYPEFEGEVKSKEITKQSVCLYEDDVNMQLKYNKFDENWSLRTVSDIYFDDTGLAFGKINIKGNSVNVTSDSFLNELKPMRGMWNSV